MPRECSRERKDPRVVERRDKLRKTTADAKSKKICGA